jgi:tetratricopeptide (TPR) repeat protein
VSRSIDAPRGAPGQSRPGAHPREQLEEADRLRQQGKLDRAEAICYPLARRYPGYIAAMHTLGLVYLDKGNFERALDWLVRASMLDPTNWMTLTALSLTYLRLGANEAAAQTLEKALAIKPQDASIFSSLGEIHREEREYEAAQHAYRRALTLDPNLETAAIGLALCLSALGQYPEAANVLSEAYEFGHRSLNLLYVMTTLPPNTVNIDVLAALDQLAVNRSAADAEFKNTFLFARAAASDRAGRHAEAWQTLVAANRPLAAQYQDELKLDIARRERALVWIRSASPTAIQPDAGGGQPISLFILGPSRSGKTSLERLISSWEGTKAGCEVPIVEKAVRRTFQAAAIPTSNYLEDLPPQLLPSFREMYLEDLARRAGPARVITNTLPGRIYDAGLIAMVVPNVRFLLVKRSLDDVVWRIYLTKYLSGNSYAYDLKAIRDYLSWYNTMIDLAADKFPEIAKVVRYETMVDDPATVLHGVAELCGLGVNGGPVPALGHDRGCAAPYRELMGHG